MAKNVAKKDSNTEVAPQGARNNYQRFGDETRRSNIEGDLLRFTKQGDWVSGPDQDEIPEGTTLIMGLNTMVRGWQKWEEQMPVDARLGLVSEGFRPCNREELGDLDEDEWETIDNNGVQVPRDPWQDTMQVLMIDPDSGQVYTFSTSSKSGKTALGDVAAVYGDRLQDGEDPEAMPVVNLMSDSYKHKTYGKVMIPVFELTGDWVKPDDLKPKPVKAKAAPAKPKGKVIAAGRNAAQNSGKAPKALPAPRGASSGGRARI